MLTTSDTYTFQAPRSRNLIDEAYERIGIIPQLITPQQIVSSQRSLNFILQSWMNKGFNLWSMQTSMVGLVGNQAAYNLPPNSSNILEATLRSSQSTTVGGNPTSSLPLVTNQIALDQPLNILGGSLLLTTGAAPFVIPNGLSLPVTFYSVSDLSAINFTINGTYNGAPQSQTIIGPNASNVATTVLFNSVTSIAYTAGSNNNVEAGLGNINNVFNTLPYNGIPTIQTAANGTMGYNWVTPNGSQQYTVTLLGITSNVTRNYNLVFSYSNDGVMFTPIISPGPVSYTAGVPFWYQITNPVPSLYFQVEETGGAILNLQSVFFNYFINDTWLNIISRREWMAYPQKNQTGRPVSYWINRQPTFVQMTLWPVPDNTGLYNNMFLSYMQMPQDIGDMQDYANIPARFLEAIVSELAYQLGLKNPQIVDPTKLQLLKQHAMSSWGEAATEDSEDVPLRIYPDYQQGYLKE